MAKDGIDVAIAAFIGARLNGCSPEEAERDAKAMLDFFGIPRRQDQSTEHPRDSGVANNAPLTDQ